MSCRRRSVVALTTLFLAIVDVTAQGEQRSVLTLYAQRRESALATIVDPLLQEILAQRVAGGVDYYNEFIDASRFAEPEFQHALRDFLKHKYAGRRFDVLIAASSPKVSSTNVRPSQKMKNTGRTVSTGYSRDINPSR